MKRLSLKSAILLILVLSAFTVGVCSCKAWRTVTTTSTYTLANDSVNNKTTTTISTKTVEEYTGVKKN